MTESVLDRSGNYLRIFNSQVKIDKSLPKWLIINNEDKSENQSENQSKNSSTPNMLNMDLSEFLALDKQDFNVYLGKRIASDLNKKQNYLTLDFDDRIVGNSLEDINVPFIKKVTKYFRTWINSDKKGEEKEEVFEFDIFQFFDNVKLTAKENQTQYAIRIEPYMIALKRANDMGQQALADKLTAELFNNKYESILFAEGFHFKITEEQVVEFIKKTEKGVQIAYVSNFIRPIPLEVIELKQKADKLLVFDNYCVMFYDPEEKSYKKTKEEEEAERRKKADPILFGMISGSRNLYYVADWIDEYCNLTLDEFINVSGINLEKLKIDEKIKI